MKRKYGSMLVTAWRDSGMSAKRYRALVEKWLVPELPSDFLWWDDTAIFEGIPVYTPVTSYSVSMAPPYELGIAIAPVADTSAGADEVSGGVSVASAFTGQSATALVGSVTQVQAGAESAQITAYMDVSYELFGGGFQVGGTDVVTLDAVIQVSALSPNSGQEHTRRIAMATNATPADPFSPAIPIAVDVTGSFDLNATGVINLRQIVAGIRVTASGDATGEATATVNSIVISYP